MGPEDNKSKFINAHLIHTRVMQAWHKNSIQRVQKINKAILAWHANADREQKKEADRFEKERLSRLMAEDEENLLVRRNISIWPSF